MAQYEPPQHPVTQCPNCLSEYDQDIYVPYVGSCAHNVCEACLGDIVVNHTCPTCKNQTFVEYKRNELALKYMSQLEDALKVIEDSKCLFDEPPVPERTPNQGGSNSRHGATGHHVTFQDEEQQPPQTTIEVLNVSPNWKKPDLNARFGPFGKIVSSYLPLFEDTQKSKEYARITYTSADEAQQAIFTQNDSPNENGGTLIVRYPASNKRFQTNAAINKRRRGQWDPKTTIYITGLANITEAQLRDHFKDHGRIVEMRLNRDPSGNLTGTAFIKYSFDHHAEQAIKYKNNSVLSGGGGKIYVDEYVPNMHNRRN